MLVLALQFSRSHRPAVRLEATLTGGDEQLDAAA